MEQSNERIQLTATPMPGGTFEILAITAGIGNGWDFPANVLQESLSLWEGAECFIDHAQFGHSIRDLAGQLSGASWDAAAGGIKAQLKVIGPSGPLLSEVGRQVLADSNPPRLGFSADIYFLAEGKTVKEILKVNSLDLVMDPARGGAFMRVLNQRVADAYNNTQPPQGVRVLNSKQKDVIMPDVIQTSVVGADGRPPEKTAQLSTLDQDRAAMAALLAEQQRQAALAAEVEQARQIRVQMCAHLMDAALTASRLPAAMQERVRKQFSGQVFTTQELNGALDDARSLVTELTAGTTVHGPAFSGMFTSEDQLQLAVNDLFGIERTDANRDVRVARLSGIRELYMMLTGDTELVGGYHPSRLMLSTTADFTGLVKNAMNKIVVNTWDQLGRAGYTWWDRIAVVEHFNSLNSITGTLVGTVGSLPTVAEGAEYTELAVGDSPETATFTKYGGYIPLTIELIDRDMTRKLAAYPRELAAAGLRKISSLVAGIFTSNSGAGPTMADGGALFNSTAVTTAGGHANLLTTALDVTPWDTVASAVYNQPMLIKNAAGVYGTGPKMAINPRFCLVPRALQLKAMQVLYPSMEHTANIFSENQQRGQPGDVITVPEWTDATDWAAVCDPLLAPAIFVGERFGIMPQIFDTFGEVTAAVFTNDEHRLKVRHFLSVWVNDFRPLHKENVAG